MGDSLISLCYAEMDKAFRSLTAVILIFAAFSPALAQSPRKVARIGILFLGGRDQPHLQALKRGLQDQGYFEGKNITFEYRYADGKLDRLSFLAAELVKIGYGRHCHHSGEWSASGSTGDKNNTHCCNDERRSG